MPILFSYGTLQREDIQRSTFGRNLAGTADALPGFEPVTLTLDDPAIVAATGTAQHRNAVYNARPESLVQGTALEVTDADLAMADGYERLASYGRIAVKLASGKVAWVYVSETRPANGRIPRFIQHVGLMIDEQRAGYSRCTLQVTPRHFNSVGVVHGGVMFTMADTAMAAALIPDLAEGESCATTNITMNYFRPVLSGPMTCTSEIVNRGKTLVNIEGEVRVDGKLVARANGSWAVFKRRTE